MTVEQQHNTNNNQNNNGTMSSQSVANHFNNSSNSNHEKYKVVFVLGPPGSGKGSQCQRVEKHFGFTHLSAGDLLRAERQRKESEFGELIEKHIREGTIVPVQITCKLLENAMRARASSPGFLVDGFPRNQDNLEGWQREMGAKADVLFVLVLNTPVEVCVQRCLNRGQGRIDDNEESLRKRWRTYTDHTKPIIDYYAGLNLVRQVDGNKSLDEVFSEVCGIFEKFGISAQKRVPDE